MFLPPLWGKVRMGVMTLFQALVLGIIQGLTEFLPVSSSAHLILTQNLFHLTGPILLAFDVIVHLGTLLALFIYFAKDLLPLPKLTRRMWGLIIVSNIPTAIIGFLLKGWMEESFNTLWVTAVTLLMNSVILWSTILAPKNNLKAEPNWWDSFWIGVSQGISILPGVSRSGATVSTALWLKVKSEEAVRFSFFIGIIPILGAAALELPKTIPVVSHAMWPALVIGFISSFIFGFLSIAVLFKVVSRGKFHDFALYTFILALICFYFSR